MSLGPVSVFGCSSNIPMSLVLQEPSGAAVPRRRPRVFLAHAGEEKHELVDTMHTLLTGLHDINTFLDEHSIPVGTEEHLQFIDNQLLAADVGVQVANLLEPSQSQTCQEFAHPLNLAWRTCHTIDP